MAAKRPVVAVAVAATLVIVGVLAFRAGDDPVVTRAGGKSPAAPPSAADDGVATTLAAAGRPSAVVPS
jgi:hypothetical protein